LNVRTIKQAANALFECVLWSGARKRKLDTIIGPKGFGPLDGYGLLVKVSSIAR